MERVFLRLIVGGIREIWNTCPAVFVNFLVALGVGGIWRVRAGGSGEGIEEMRAKRKG